ncbi:MAG: phospho-N-acetylmuramoyl-pentapeptide-transferase [Intestinibacillus sp.]
MLFLGLVALVTAFVVTVVIAKPIIGWLRRMRFGQKILEIGPKWHMNKQNIPTMGGFLFIIGITAAVLLCLLLYYLSDLTGVLTGVIGLISDWRNISAVGVIGGADGPTSILVSTRVSSILSGVMVLGLALAYGAVGMVDDLAKIKKKQNAGLTPIQKLILQIVVAAVFITVLRIAGGVDTAVWVPFVNVSFRVPWVIYIILSAFIIVGADNAVNLTDGLDGLAAGVTVPVALFFVAVGFRQNNAGVVIFAAALAGALVAFLIFNFNPAKVFMGDTGSLFLGGAVSGLAFACDMPLILIPVGIIYIWETLSVIIQVAYFKLTHGKRVFKMAPFHHHLEMCGWSERKIVITFALITAVLCAIAWCFGVTPHAAA